MTPDLEFRIRNECYTHDERAGRLAFLVELGQLVRDLVGEDLAETDDGGVAR
jgi:hypothetical protein